MNERTRTVFAAAIWLTVVVGGWCHAAHADLVFGNFDDTTQLEQSGYVVVYTPSNPAAEFEWAIPFTVTGGDFLLDSIVIPVFAIPGGKGQPPVFGTSAFFSIYADNGGGIGGEPGEPLESTPVTSDLEYVTTGPPFPAPVTISFGGSTLLQDGKTYWIGAAETGNTSIAWQISPGAALPGQSRTRNLAFPYVWFDGPPFVSLGLQVHGTLVPGPWAITALVLPLLCAGRRRQ